MSSETATVQRQIQKVAELVQRLESSTDPDVRAMARELLESLMSFHGAALERILEFAANSGEAGETIIQKCGSDELVSSLLLLYGLHPQDLQTRVTRALEKSRKFLEGHSAAAEIVSVGEDGAVIVQLYVQANGCESSAASVKSTLEAALQDATPDAPSIIVEMIESGLPKSGFVSLERLLTRPDAGFDSPLAAPERSSL
jgi:Fe-S cluster biogenesis protein NfuA